MGACYRCDQCLIDTVIAMVYSHGEIANCDGSHKLICPFVYKEAP